MRGTCPQYNHAAVAHSGVGVKAGVVPMGLINNLGNVWSRAGHWGDLYNVDRADHPPIAGDELTRHGRPIERPGDAILANANPFCGW